MATAGAIYAQAEYPSDRGNEYRRSFVRRTGRDRKGKLVVPVGQRDGVGSQVSGVQHPRGFDGPRKDVAASIESGKRYIFPIDACYEWLTKGKGRPLVKIMLADRQQYAIAGLWSRWPENGSPRWSFATSPNVVEKYILASL